VISMSRCKSFNLIQNKIVERSVAQGTILCRYVSKKSYYAACIVYSCILVRDAEQKSLTAKKTTFMKFHVININLNHQLTGGVIGSTSSI
jgi:hypothetical protein